MYVIVFRSDDLKPLYFDNLPATWTHDKATARRFETAQAAADFARVWRLTDGALVEQV